MLICEFKTRWGQALLTGVQPHLPVAGCNLRLTHRRSICPNVKLVPDIASGVIHCDLRDYTKTMHAAEANLCMTSTTVLQIIDYLLYNHQLHSFTEWAATPVVLWLPGRGLSRGLASLVEHTGPWPSAKHGRSGAFPPGETQINVRGQEPGVAVPFHQTVDFRLSGFKTAPCGFPYVPLDGHFGVIVNVDLNERKFGQSHINR